MHKEVCRDDGASVVNETERSIDHQQAHTMTDSNSNNFTDTQFQTLLSSDHIRKYLLKEGLIDHQGNIVPKKEYERKHRSRQRGHSSGPLLYTADTRKRARPASVRRPFRSNTRQKNVSNSKQVHPIVSRNVNSHNREIKSASVTQHKPLSKRQPSTRLSPLHRSRRSRSPSPRRTDILKRPIPITEPCTITMIYYGPQTVIEYDSSWFEPDGDEVLIMQQHCGGENLIAFKGFLKPNQTFMFKSFRHQDFPFALAFYVKGLIDSRLSACCECKHKHGVRLGGRRGLFGIKNVEKSVPCRRCRCERRMKKLTESKSKSPVVIDPSRYQTSVVPRVESPMRTPSPQEREQSAKTRSRSSTVSYQKPQATSSPKKEEDGETYALDFDESDSKTHSLNSTPREHEVRKLDTPEASAVKNDDHQRPPSVVSSKKDSDDEATPSLSDDLNDDFKRPRPVSHESDRKE